MSFKNIVNAAVATASGELYDEKNTSAILPKGMQGMCIHNNSILTPEANMEQSVPKGASGGKLGTKLDIPTLCPPLPEEVGKSAEIAGCKITCIEEPTTRKIPGTAHIFNWGGDKTSKPYGKYKCESEYLGDFEFDSADFTVGYKTTTNVDGVEVQTPILRYQDLGLENTGTNVDLEMLGPYGAMTIGTVPGSEGTPVQIPDGVKRLDYTFENTSLKQIPYFPDSVISADSAFVGCQSIREQLMEYGDYLDDITPEQAVHTFDLYRVGLYYDTLGNDAIREDMAEYWTYLNQELKLVPEKLQPENSEPVIHSGELLRNAFAQVSQNGQSNDVFEPKSSSGIAVREVLVIESEGEFDIDEPKL